MTKSDLRTAEKRIQRNVLFIHKLSSFFSHSLLSGWHIIQDSFYLLCFYELALVPAQLQMHSSEQRAASESPEVKETEDNSVFLCAPCTSG